MQYNYSKIVVKSVEEFYQKLQEGYIFSNIELEESKKDDLYDYIQSQPDSVLKQCSLGNCYFYGYGVSKDHEKAVYWYEKAANQGAAYAQNNLGACYYDGEGVPKDYEKAVYWYEKAANQGDAKAQCNLGYCYYEGEGVPKDYEKAVYWLKKSVNQDWPIALIGLGMCYLLGDGVPRNYDQALYLSKKAVDKGVERADEFFMQVKKYIELYPR